MFKYLLAIIPWCMNLAYLLRMFMIHCLTGSMFDILSGLVLFWQLASFLAVLWALNVLAFLYSKFIHIPPYACPLALVIFLILYLINPFPILHYSSRMWLLKILVSGSILQGTTNVITAKKHYCTMLLMEYSLLYASTQILWLNRFA